MLPLWRTSPFTRSSMARFMGSSISSAVTIHGPIGQNVSMPLQNEKTPDFISRRWMSRAVMSLKTVKPAMWSIGLLGAEELARLADDHREFELVVELVREVLGVDDRVVRADDRVDVLEEDDALVHRVRPVDRLELFVVRGEVAGGVEELLRHDRGAQPHVGEREALAGLADLAVVLEVLRGSTARRAR